MYKTLFEAKLCGTVAVTNQGCLYRVQKRWETSRLKTHVESSREGK